MSLYKISVIIATKDRKDFLLSLIKDLLNQDFGFENFEVCVVDNSSIKVDFINKELVNLNYKYFHKPSFEGPCKMRNFAAEIACGKYLLFLDDDISIKENVLKMYWETINRYNCDWVVGALCKTDWSYNNLNYSVFIKNAFSDISLMKLIALPSCPGLFPTFGFGAGCSLISSKLFKEIGMFDESFDPTAAGEDRNLAMRLLGNNCWGIHNGDIRILHFGVPTGGSRPNGSRVYSLRIHWLLTLKVFVDKSRYLLIKIVFLYDLINTMIKRGPTKDRIRQFYNLVKI
jgi:glycosyltransferase involved in cell wall biosynthesis